MDYQGKNILVIGASGALGSLLAQALVAKGANVIGTARSQASVQKIPSQIQTKLVLDLENLGSIGELILALSNESIHGVINA